MFNNSDKYSTITNNYRIWIKPIMIISNLCKHIQINKTKIKYKSLCINKMNKKIKIIIS